VSNRLPCFIGDSGSELVRFVSRGEGNRGREGGEGGGNAEGSSKPLLVLKAWLGWAYLAKKMQSPQPRPSQPPSNSALDSEKMGS
jgi:hypothetical protein